MEIVENGVVGVQIIRVRGEVCQGPMYAGTSEWDLPSGSFARGQQWHHLPIVRSQATNCVPVYFDIEQVKKEIFRTLFAKLSKFQDRWNVKILSKGP